MLNKLKSRKFWGTVFGSLLPIITQALTGELTWQAAVFSSLSILAVGLGLIGWEDVNRLKASAAIHIAKPPAPTP